MKMKAVASLSAVLLALGLLAGGQALAADDSKTRNDNVTDDSKVKEGARQVESGAYCGYASFPHSRTPCSG